MAGYPCDWVIAVWNHHRVAVVYHQRGVQALCALRPIIEVLNAKAGRGLDQKEVNFLVGHFRRRIALIMLVWRETGPSSWFVERLANGAEVDLAFPDASAMCGLLGGGGWKQHWFTPWSG